jgi:hypothetical protein
MSFLDSKYLFSDWNFDLLATGFASAEDKLNKLLLKPSPGGLLNSEKGIPVLILVSVLCSVQFKMGKYCLFPRILKGVLVFLVRALLSPFCPNLHSCFSANSLISIVQIQHLYPFYIYIESGICFPWFLISVSFLSALDEIPFFSSWHTDWILVDPIGTLELRGGRERRTVLMI